MLNQRDLLTKARSRYTGTFKEDVPFDLFVKTLLDYLIQSQESAFTFVDGIFNIDKSSGKMLDLIGKIVNQGRVLVAYSLDMNFGFRGHPLAEGFGTITNPNVGGYWKDSSNQNAKFRVLTDDEYRLILKARILSNNSGGTTDDLIKVVNVLTQSTNARVETDGSGDAVLVVSTNNLEFLQYFYTRIGASDALLPIPLGVNLKIEVI